MNKIRNEKENRDAFIEEMKKYVASESKKEEEQQEFLYKELKEDGIFTEKDVTEQNLEKILRKVNKYIVILEMNVENSLSSEKYITFKEGQFYEVNPDNLDEKIKVIDIKVISFDIENLDVEIKFSNGGWSSFIISKDEFSKRLQELDGKIPEEPGLDNNF